MITIGDWVVYMNRGSMFFGAIGFVTNYAEDDGFYVRLVRGMDGQIYNRTIYCKERSLKCVTDMYNMSDEEYNVLIDMALATKDFEWCREIQRRYEEGKTCVM